MPTVTVLEKLYAAVSPSAFEKSYSNLVNGLDVQVGFVGTTKNGWIQLDVSGTDQTIALSLFDREFGLAPDSLDGLKRFSAMRGRVAFSKKNASKLSVDLPAGSSSVTAVVSEKSLQGQLADGKAVPFERMVELFCLVDNLPVEVKLSKVKGELKAVLSEVQVSLFRSWVQMRVDRLMVFGVLFSDVEKAVNSCRLSRDVMRVESLGFLEQAVLCKLGTDAVGLIPKLGRVLKSAVLVPFSPKKVIKQIGNEAFDD
ncbi:MAG: hypothetical protein CW716_06530 [Candidatus Bathyarchaeum sp.]|nr:MAG: hypothetical protein CW716_06530 [Candidatus Bathyarchaeum sp.]